ncbi:MAG: exo-alpha-sialidase [Candidatus Hydrogenedentes bacterium]|nr:exo-alpha-sialidase [Candidatus Hydrogenedentota bacterium]
MFLICFLMVSSLTADTFLNPPQVILLPGETHSGVTRNFQGIPSMDRSPAGRLWATWYGGKGDGEDESNYVILVTSGDNGNTWSDEVLVVDPGIENPTRAYDPNIWLDPTGKLWLFWAQTVGHDGTVAGVWCITTDTPDKVDALWSAPRRLTDGVMMCKPTVLSTGEWILPVSTWRETDNSARLIASTDKGETWNLQGACHVPKAVRSFDEHMIVEKKDGKLWLLARTRYGIGESISCDSGHTWRELTPSSISHPSARFFIRRLQSGNLLLVKHGPIDKQTKRSHLTAFLSEDDGGTWVHSLLLDERVGVSYPDGFQASDGTIYIIYDYDRTGEKKILMTTFTEDDILTGEYLSDKARQRVLVHQAF